MPYALPTQAELPYAAGSDTSDAALQARHFVGRQGLQVLVWFEQRGSEGGTQRECAEALQLGRPSVCARVRALEQYGALVKTSARRKGCAVYRAANA